jgi:hypothetical protein
MIKRTFAISAIALSSLLSLQTMALVNNPSYVSAQVGAAIPSGKLAHETLSPTPTRKKAAEAAAVFNLCGGIEIYKNSYAELELAYANHTFRDRYPVLVPPNLATNESFRTRFQTLSGFANLSYRFNNLNSFIVPYITVGAGVSSNKVGYISISESTSGNTEGSRGKTITNAAWQIGAGTLMKLTKKVSVNLSYKYRHLGNVKTTHTVQGSPDPSENRFLQGRIRTHNILLGVAVDL